MDFIYVIVVIIVLIADLIWLSLMKPFYQRLVYQVQRMPLTINIVGAVLSYICVIISLLLFSIPLASQSVEKRKWHPLLASFVYGGLLGLIVYGIFNFTNLAIFANYDLKIGLVDTLWGVLLYTLATFIALLGR
jgi:uncharacterized membrane protein